MNIVEQIQHSFRGHVAKYQETELEGGTRIQYLRWGPEKGSNYLVVYLCIGNALIVRGDLEEAIYQVTDTHGLSFWEDTDIMYFQEKCVASPEGRGTKWRDWCATRCRERLETYMGEVDETPEVGDPLSHIGDQDDWRQFVLNNQRFFGDDYYTAFDWGRVPKWQLRAHHMGLKMALKQLRENGVEV